MIWLEYELKSRCYDCEEGKKQNRNITLIHVRGKPYRYYCNNGKQDCSIILALDKTLKSEKRINELEKQIEELRKRDVKLK